MKAIGFLAGTMAGLGLVAAGGFALIGEPAVDAVTHGAQTAVLLLGAFLILWTTVSPASFVRWRYQQFGVFRGSDRREPWLDRGLLRKTRILSIAWLVAMIPYGVVYFFEMRRAGLLHLIP